MKTYDQWTQVQHDLGVIELLQLIRTTMYSGTATNNSTLTYIEAEVGLLTCKQTKQMSNSKYLETFRNRAEVYILFGGEPGTSISRVDSRLQVDAIDPDNPTDEERLLATAQVREEYLAVLFIKNSDASKYGKRIMDLKVRYVERNENEGDPYPATLTKALEMLETWHEALKRSRKHTSTYDESGIAYLNIDGDSTEQQDTRNDRGQGRGGRAGGRGSNGARGGGRGPRGGAGRGRGRSNQERYHNTHETHNVNDDDDEEDMGMFEHNNNDTNIDINHYSNVCYNITRAQSLNVNKSNTLIIDSGSTADIIGDRNMVHDVHHAPQPLRVRTVNGTTTISKKAYLGDYPLPVWFHPKGGVNILSLYNMQKFYRCTMDTDESNSINIHLLDGSVLQFSATEYDRLYKCVLKSHQSIDNIWNLLADAATPKSVLFNNNNICDESETLFPDNALFQMNKKNCFNIDTVASRADKYTKRQVKAAVAARKLENIIMRPGNRKFTDVCIPHFRGGCPITSSDVRAANDIFGKNLGSLKGKTAQTAEKHVKTNIEPVPPEILKLHKDVTIAIDVMFVNKVPFLITTSRNLHFGTVEALPDRKLNTVVSKLRSVVNTYHHRGFSVTSILADGEFEPIRPWFPSLNTCAENEHMPDVERFIRTVKDSTRSIYRMLPFTRIPRIILIHLVKIAFFLVKCISIC